MNGAIITYFDGEKNAGLLVAGVGAAAMVVAAILFGARWELRSFAVTVGVCALLELAIGVGLYLKTGPQVQALLAGIGADAGAALAAEGARMAKVQRNFVYLEYVWLALLCGGAIIAIAQKSRFMVAGIALGLVCHAAILLTFDLVAERRGAIYKSALDGRRA